MTQYDFFQTDFKNASSINAQQLNDEINALNISSATFTGLLINVAENTADPDFICSVITSEPLSIMDYSAIELLINNYIYAAPKTDIICFLKDIKSAGTNGGTFSANVWHTRELNTLEGDVDFCTLGVNQFTIQEGEYLIKATAPACDVQAHQIKLYNVSNSTEIMGQSNYSTGGVTTFAELNTSIFLNSANVFEIQHICSKTITNIGRGKSNGWGDEIYTIIMIQKI